MGGYDGLMDTKQCSRCGEIKVLADFHKNKSARDGHNAACKACRKHTQAETYKQNSAKIQARNLAWRRANPDKIQVYSRKLHIQRYGITEERWQDIFSEQGQACAICRTKDPGKKGWATDHDHTCCAPRTKCCGQCVRGILCGACNLGLGKFQDNIVFLRAAIDYLDNSR